jgi:hypothetical protein
MSARSITRATVSMGRSTFARVQFRDLFVYREEHARLLVPPPPQRGTG